MIFHNPLFKKSLSYILPSKITVPLYLVLKTKGIAVDFRFSLIKCWRSSKLIEESAALGSSASLYPLHGFKFLHEETFLFDKCVKIVVVVCVCLFFCIADDLTSKETVEDGLRMALRPACAKIVQSLSSFYDIWCPGFLFHQIVSLCKYSLYRGAKYTRSYSLQPETRSWRSFLISFSGRYAQRNIPDKYRSMIYVLKTKVRAIPSEAHDYKRIAFKDPCTQLFLYIAF